MFDQITSWHFLLITRRRIRRMGDRFFSWNLHPSQSRISCRSRTFCTLNCKKAKSHKGFCFFPARWQNWKQIQPRQNRKTPKLLGTTNSKTEGIAKQGMEFSPGKWWIDQFDHETYYSFTWGQQVVVKIVPRLQDKTSCWLRSFFCLLKRYFDSLNMMGLGSLFRNLFIYNYIIKFGLVYSTELTQSYTFSAISLT